MTNFNIAVISTNNFNVDGNYMDKQEITEQLTNEIGNVINFQSSSDETMMEQIINVTNMTPELMGDTSLCTEDENYVIQLCHVSPDDNSGLALDNNGIGSYLVADNRKIYGNIVVMKFKITDDNTCINASLELSDIIDIIYKKFNHAGVFIDVNGNMTEFLFKETPLEYLHKNLHPNYKSMDVNLFGNMLLMFAEIFPNDNKVNKVATRLAGNCIVNGNIIMATKGSDLLFSNLTKEYLEKLEKLCWGKFSDRKLKGLEIKNREKQDKLPIVMNGYRVVEKRLMEHKKVCYGCDNEIKNVSMVCTGCYRIAYDSIECQKNHWNEHAKECLMNKKPVNEALRLNLNVASNTN